MVTWSSLPWRVNVPTDQHTHISHTILGLENPNQQKEVGGGNSRPMLEENSTEVQTFTALTKLCGGNKPILQ